MSKVFIIVHNIKVNVNNIIPAKAKRRLQDGNLMKANKMYLI